MKYGIILALCSTLFLVEAQVSMHNPSYCYSTDPIRPQNGMHTTQSSYEAIRRPGINPGVSTCPPGKFYMLSRTGGRWPPLSYINAIREFAAGPFRANLEVNFNAGRTGLCMQDMDLLRNWTLSDDMVPENEQNLTPAGWNIMRDLATRYQAWYPQLLPNTFSAVNYTFRTTNRPSAIDSARAFAEGLFGHTNIQMDPIPEMDILLRPTDNCPAFWMGGSMVEANAFAEGPEVAQMVAQMNADLGFQGQQSLTFETIQVMWEICKFEKSDDLQTTSPFCAAFSIAHTQILEFHSDLEYYYNTGFGFPDQDLMLNLPCAITQDLLNHWQNFDGPNARILITQADVLQVFVTKLLAFDDEESITRHNIGQTANRLWRSSWIAPKGGHLAVVKYDCEGDDDDLFVMFNERPLIIPGCQPNGLCKLQFIRERYNRFVDANCPQIFCTSTNPGAAEVVPEE